MAGEPTRSGLPAGWTYRKLAELGEVNRGRSRHRPRYDPLLYGGPYPFIQTGDIKASGGRITSYTQTYNETGLAQSRLWPAGTMCLSIAANIAETGILAFDACFPDSVVGFIADDAQCDVRFVEYLFRRLRSGIQSQASGTAQDNINLETLQRLDLRMPPLPTQRAIAHILGTLDDKIELNRCMNETLEAMARALFKSWFVDFDPVRAKAEGRTPTGMDAETAKLFPSEFVESELGRIPKGWRVLPVERLAAKHPNAMATGPFGSAISAKHFTDAGIPVIRGKNLSENPSVRLLDIGLAFLSPEKAREFGRSIARIGDLVFTCWGTIGQVGLIDNGSLFEEYIVSNKQMKLTPDDGIALSDYLYLLFTSPHVSELIKNQAIGSSVPGFNLTQLRAIPLLVPPIAIQRRFLDLFGPMRLVEIAREAESRSLAAIRDELLPRLLCGELPAVQPDLVVEGTT